MKLYTTANAFTWTATMAEVAIGVWIAEFVGWPVFGGVVIGLAMGCQFARIARCWAEKLESDHFGQ